MKQIFDLIEAINDTAMAYFERTGQPPFSIAISPRSYRQLIEIKSSEERFDNLIIGCSAIRELETSVGNVRIIIDELLEDTSVEVT
jgi:hypothetical protein